MHLKSIRTNQLSPSGFVWYTKYLTALDARDMETLLSLVAEDAFLQLNNQMPIYGKAAIAEVVRRDWQGFKSAEYEPLNVVGTDNEFAAEVLCHYTRWRGDVFTVPAASFKTRNAEGLLTSVRLFVDITPLAQ